MKLVSSFGFWVKAWYSRIKITPSSFGLYCSSCAGVRVEVAGVASGGRAAGSLDFLGVSGIWAACGDAAISTTAGPVVGVVCATQSIAAPVVGGALLLPPQADKASARSAATAT